MSLVIVRDHKSDQLRHIIPLQCDRMYVSNAID